MKNVLISIIVLLCATWIGVSASQRTPNLLVSRKGFPLPFDTQIKGVDGLKVNQFIKTSVPPFSILSPLGYDLKFESDELPAWLFTSGSVKGPKSIQIVLRDEVIDEFETPSSKSVYLKNSDFVLTRYAIDKKQFENTYLLLVPSKIFANQVVVDPSQIRFEHYQKFDANKGLKQVGSFETQSKIEAYLIQQKVALISLLDLYQKLNQQGNQPYLYPRGESHWGAEVILSVAKSIVAQLQVPSGCMQTRDSTQFTDSTEVGDLVLALQPSDSLAKKLATPIRTPVYSKAPSLPGCPALYFVGTSYGEHYVPNADIATAIRYYYRGEVKNESIGGGGTLKPMEEFLKSHQGNSKDIIIWEFPFRAFKDHV